MDPPLINESSFSAANPSAYSLAEIWPFPVNSASAIGEPTAGLGLRIANFGQIMGQFADSSANRDVSVDESTVTEQSGSRGGGRKRKDVSSEDESSKIVSTSSGSGMVGIHFSISILTGVSFFIFLCREGK